jgi:DNA-binding transcriptional MerR regulator
VLGAARVKSPDAFRTISEVAEELDVPQHVLRFWEGRFSQIKPVKRAGGRRYYRPEDVDLLRGIRTLLYVDGFTIKGVQKILREKGLRHVADMGRAEVKAKARSAKPAAARSNVISIDRTAEREPELPLDLFSAPARAQPRPAPKRTRDSIAEIERAFASAPEAPQPVADEEPPAMAAPAMPPDALIPYPVPLPVSAEPDRQDRGRAQLESLLGELLALKSRLRSHLH